MQRRQQRGPTEEHGVQVDQQLQQGPPPRPKPLAEGEGGIRAPDLIGQEGRAEGLDRLGYGVLKDLLQGSPLL